MTKFSPQTVADLSLLTQVFDDPEVDLLHSLSRFVREVSRAVPSYIGVTVEIVTRESRGTIDIIQESARTARIGSSLLIPASLALGLITGNSTASAPIIGLIVYAGMPGAFVDLAADLGWLTEIPPPGFALDQHLDGPAPASGSISASARIHQAIGLLIGTGLTPEEAQEAIAARASAEQVSWHEAADAILDGLP